MHDIGLLTLLSIIMLWPDFTFGEHLIYGFPAVGHCEWSGVFPRREVTSSERTNPFEGAADHNKSILKSMRPGKDDCVILEKSLEDARKGFATLPLDLDELNTQLRGKEFRLIRRFVITQSTGKQRSNALQPAHHLSTSVAELDARNMHVMAGRRRNQFRR